MKIDDVVYQAELIDESIGGLRVGGLDLAYLYLGHPVLISLRGEVISGHCRTVDRDANNQLAVGICRDVDELEVAQSSAPTLLVNSFIPMGDFKLVCERLETRHDGQIRLRLISGNEFTVANKQLIALTRNERESELRGSEGDCSAELCRIYTEMTGYQYQSVDEILATEFGQLSQVPG